MSKLSLLSLLFALFTVVMIPTPALARHANPTITPTSVDIDNISTGTSTVSIFVTGCPGSTMRFYYNFNGGTAESTIGLFEPTQAGNTSGTYATKFTPPAAGSYNIHAQCGDISDTTSGTLTVTSGRTLQSSPTGLQLEGATNTELRFRWSALQFASKYQISYTNKTNNQTFPTVETTNTRYAIQGLNPSTTYEVRVKGCNDVNCSDPAAASFTTFATQQANSCCGYGFKYDGTKDRCVQISNPTNIANINCPSGTACDATTNACISASGLPTNLPPAPAAPVVVAGVGGCKADEFWSAIGCIPTDTGKFISTLLRFLTAAGGGIALLLMISGAFQMITSAGNPEHVKHGQQQFTSAVIGLLFIIFSVLLLKVIGVDILNLPGFIP